MSQLSRDHWPPSVRYGYCRAPLGDSGCGLKEGSPFGPFWDELGVDFVDSIYTGLGYDVHISAVADDWLNKLVTMTIYSFNDVVKQVSSQSASSNSIKRSSC